MSEPTVLDYVKEKLIFWKPGTLHLPSEEELAALEAAERAAEPAESITQPEAASPEWSWSTFFPVQNFPLRAVVAFLLALVAQISLEPPAKNVRLSLILYVLSFALAAWSFWVGEWHMAEATEEAAVSEDFTFRKWAVIASVPLIILTYVTFSGFKEKIWFVLFGMYQFKFLNTLLWVAAIFVTVAAFVDFPHTWQEIRSGVRSWLVTWPKRIKINPYTLLLLLVTGVIIFFRVYRLADVPAEMTSDHAEKLLDVQDVLNNITNVFFQRNTGREAIQFYLTAAIIKLFHTGITFMSLKIGTVLAGLGALPFIYLLGKEIANKRVAVVATLLAGTAYWANVISRVGLRFPLYPLFVAPALYYLVRGIRHKKRNDFIWSGIALGLGMHGYSPFRIVPFIIIVAWIIYLLSRRPRESKEFTLTGVIILAVVSLVVFLPLFRYMIGNPDIFLYRTLTRLGEVEQPYPGSPVLIFFDNLWNAMLMFGYNDGLTWLHSIPLRPGLDVIGAVFFYLGYILLIVRAVRKPNWLDVFLVLSVPLLMMPSILSLAFPVENPTLNRTSGAIVPVFIIIALALDGFVALLERSFASRTGKVVANVIGLLLIVLSLKQNYKLTFEQYPEQFALNAGNTSEIGQVIHDFANSFGTYDSAWVVGYPYWIDTRVVSLRAGTELHDMAIWPEQFSSTLEIPGPKLFILNTADIEDLQTLKSMYPLASVKTYTSKVQGKDFLIMLAPVEP